MASVNTTLYAAQVSTRVDQARLPAPASKKVEFMRIPWTSTALPTGDIVNLCVLPPGVIPRPDLSSVQVTDTGWATSTAVVDIGTAADPNGWCEALNIADVCSAPMCPLASAPPAYAAKTELAADSGSKNVAIYATFTLGATAVAGKLLYFNLAYELPG
jgi:hypothetical protein